MAKRSADAVRNKELKITPASPHEKTWFNYLDNIRYVIFYFSVFLKSFLDHGVSRVSCGGAIAFLPI